MITTKSRHPSPIADLQHIGVRIRGQRASDTRGKFSGLTYLVMIVLSIRVSAHVLVSALIWLYGYPSLA